MGLACLHLLKERLESAAVFHTVRLPAVLTLLSALLTSPFLEAVFAMLCLQSLRVSFCALIPLDLLLAAVSVGTVSPCRRPGSGAIRSS